MNAHDFVQDYSRPTMVLSDEARHFLDTPTFREQVLREIHTNFSPSHAPLLREILRREMESRREDLQGEYFENLYWCAFLLYRVADLADIHSLWQAKQIDFDTYCALDIQFLVGAGVDETIEHLESQADTESKDALEYILECRAAGDFDNLEKWYQWRDKYFSALS